MSWGFPNWKGSGVIINARAETAMEKSLFRTPLLTHRLVIPSTGFYEWTHPKDKTPKEKYLLRRPDDPMLYMAGFYNLFKAPDGTYEERFVILTTAANESISPLHDRMPVILDPDERESWLRDLGRVDRLLTRGGPKLTLTKIPA
jgi:putative SOS response-associated peptidase YedK